MGTICLTAPPEPVWAGEATYIDGRTWVRPGPAWCWSTNGKRACGGFDTPRGVSLLPGEKCDGDYVRRDILPARDGGVYYGPYGSRRAHAPGPARFIVGR